MSYLYDVVTGKFLDEQRPETSGFCPHDVQALQPRLLLVTDAQAARRKIPMPPDMASMPLAVFLANQ